MNTGNNKGRYVMELPRQTDADIQAVSARIARVAAELEAIGNLLDPERVSFQGVKTLGREAAITREVDKAAMALREVLYLAGYRGGAR